MDLSSSLFADGGGFELKATRLSFHLLWRISVLGWVLFPHFLSARRQLDAILKPLLPTGWISYLRWLFTYASVTNLCSLVLDRYIAVVNPLKYLLFMTRKRVSQLIFLSWILSVLVVCLDVLAWLVFNDSISVFLVNTWILMILEILSCCSLIFYFGSMLHVVYKHERAARSLAKQLRFNHRYLLKNEEKSAVKLMVIVIGLFLVCCACYLRCSLVYIMKDEQPCNDKRFKLPLLVLNSAINPVAYAFFKRDIKEEVERCICCVIWKKRNNIEPLNDSRLFPN